MTDFYVFQGVFDSPYISRTYSLVVVAVAKINAVASNLPLLLMLSTPLQGFAVFAVFDGFANMPAVDSAHRIFHKTYLA